MFKINDLHNRIVFDPGRLKHSPLFILIVFCIFNSQGSHKKCEKKEFQKPLLSSLKIRCTNKNHLMCLCFLHIFKVFISRTKTYVSIIMEYH